MSLRPSRPRLPREQVHARHILVETREEADEALARLWAGEDFGALAAELSIDTSNKDEGGDLGWFPRGVMTPPFEEAVFAMQPGELSDAVETDIGFHIIRLEEREANRELEPDALEAAQRQTVDDWFEARRTSPEVVRLWDWTMVPTEAPTPVFRG